MRLVCKLIGHNYFQHPSTLPQRGYPGVTPFVYCTRCGKEGWLL